MKSLQIKIEILTYWHAGSGASGTGDVDAAIIRDAQGLPYLPGRTLKGLFRDAARLLHTHRPKDAPNPDVLFGQEGGMSAAPAGLLYFSDARMPAPFRQWEASQPTKKKAVLAGLTETVASTKLDKDGIADDGSLRKIEYAIPMSLESVISWENSPNEKQTASWVHEMAPLIRRLGSSRHRGFGRCRVSVNTI